MADNTADTKEDAAALVRHAFERFPRKQEVATADSVAAAFASLRADLDAKFAALRKVDTATPNTIYQIRDRQGKVVENLNQLVSNK